MNPIEVRKNQWGHVTYVGGYVHYRVEHFEPFEAKIPPEKRPVVGPPKPEEVLAEVIRLGITSDVILVRGRYGEVWLNGQQWSC